MRSPVAMKVITLTTDFGTRDWFVGTVKGVILGIQPAATIVDISHEIPPGDIPAGAYVLAAAAGCFPAGTVHVAVVDPGVGSSRGAIAVRTARHTFVGPDNGLLSWALAKEEVQEIVRLENRQFFRKDVSRTFHARDLFAPVAAHLSQGVPVAELGSRISKIEPLQAPPFAQEAGAWKGVVCYIDRFGNAITNLPNDLPIFREPERVRIRVGGSRTRIPLCEYYRAVAPGKPLGILGSNGTLEIAVCEGNASEALRLSVRDPVTAEWKP